METLPEDHLPDSWLVTGPLFMFFTCLTSERYPMKSLPPSAEQSATAKPSDQQQSGEQPQQSSDGSPRAGSMPPSPSRQQQQGSRAGTPNPNRPPAAGPSAPDNRASCISVEKVLNLFDTLMASGLASREPARYLLPPLACLVFELFVVRAAPTLVSSSSSSSSSASSPPSPSRDSPAPGALTAAASELETQRECLIASVLRLLKRSHVFSTIGQHVAFHFAVILHQLRREDPAQWQRQSTQLLGSFVAKLNELSNLVSTSVRQPIGSAKGDPFSQSSFIVQFEPHSLPSWMQFLASTSAASTVPGDSLVKLAIANHRLLCSESVYSQDSQLLSVCSSQLLLLCCLTLHVREKDLLEQLAACNVAEQLRQTPSALLHPLLAQCADRVRLLLAGVSAGQLPSSSSATASEAQQPSTAAIATEPMDAFIDMILADLALLLARLSEGFSSGSSDNASISSDHSMRTLAFLYIHVLSSLFNSSGNETYRYKCISMGTRTDIVYVNFNSPIAIRVYSLYTVFQLILYMYIFQGNFPHLRERAVLIVGSARSEDFLCVSSDVGSLTSSNRGAVSLLLSAVEVACCEPHTFAQLARLLAKDLEYSDARWWSAALEGRALGAGDGDGDGNSARGPNGPSDASCDLALRRYRVGLCFRSAPSPSSPVVALAGSSHSPLLVDRSRVLACRKLLTTGGSAKSLSAALPALARFLDTAQSTTRSDLPDAAPSHTSKRAEPEPPSPSAVCVDGFQSTDVNKRLEELSGTSDRGVGAWLVATRTHSPTSSPAVCLVLSEQRTEFRTLVPLLETLEPSTLNSLISQLVRSFINAT